MILDDANSPAVEGGAYHIGYCELVDGYRHAYEAPVGKYGYRTVVRYSRGANHPPDPRCPECAARLAAQRPTPAPTEESYVSAKPMRVFLSPLTGRAYAIDRYRESAGSGRIEVTGEKHDVTDDVVHDLMAAAWARGWNECNAATAGDAPPNPYRHAPSTAPLSDAGAESGSQGHGDAGGGSEGEGAA